MSLSIFWCKAHRYENGATMPTTKAKIDIAELDTFGLAELLGLDLPATACLPHAIKKAREHLEAIGRQLPTKEQATWMALTGFTPQRTDGKPISQEWLNVYFGRTIGHTSNVPEDVFTAARQIVKGNLLLFPGDDVPYIVTAVPSGLQMFQNATVVAMNVTSHNAYTREIILPRWLLGYGKLVTEFSTE